MTNFWITHKIRTVSSILFSDSMAGDVCTDFVTYDHEILSISDVKTASTGNLLRLAKALRQSRLPLEHHFSAAFGSLFVSFTSDIAEFSGEEIRVAPTGLASSRLEEGLRAGELSYLGRRDSVATEAAVERPPHSAVIADACRAMGHANSSAPSDVLAWTPIGVLLRSTGACRVIRRVDAAELRERLRELAQVVRVVLVTRLEHLARKLVAPARTSSAVPLYLLLLAACRRYGRRAEPSGAHPSLSWFKPSAGSALAAC